MSVRTPQTARHDHAVRLVAQNLRQRRFFTGVEVGLAGGRVDIAVVEGREIRWLFEVKVREERKGVGQLLRYRALLGSPASLTLVVDTHRVTTDLRVEAAAAAVGLWTLDLSAPLIGDPAWEYQANLPRIHEDERRRAQAALTRWMDAHEYVPDERGRPWGYWRPRAEEAA